MNEETRKLGSVFGAGRYLVQDMVGRGGVGAVYRAVQQPLGREVALKILRPEYSSHLAVRRRFTREARAVATLNHPNIATVFDFGAEEDGTLFLAMEFVPGRSLARAMCDGLTPRHLLTILEPILGALAHAHARGVIHRDLKPDNILIGSLDASGALPSPEEIAAHPQLIKLVDFGIASVQGVNGHLHPGETREGEVVGTPLYMSPEQARGEKSLSPATDLYTLGVLLYEGLTGEHPFATQDPGETSMDIMIRHVTQEPPPLEVPPGVYVPEALEEIVDRLLRKRPQERFHSAALLRNAVQEVIAHLTRRVREVSMRVRGTDAHVPTLPENEAVREVQAPSARAPGVRFEAPLIARNEERELLQEVAALCIAENRGQVVLIDGEAGVGKTRLATWFKHLVEERGAMRCSSGVFLRDGSAGLYGVRESLEDLLQVRHLDRSRLKTRLGERFGALEDEPRGDVELLTSFLRPEDASSGAMEKMGQEALFALLLRVWESACRERPLLLIFDDIQWAGAELADLLGFLAVEFRYRPLQLLVLCTVRKEDLRDNPRLEEGLRQLSRYEGESTLRLHLPRLRIEESENLVDAILPVDTQIRQSIVERSGGNALHLLQLLQYLYQKRCFVWSEEAQRFLADPASERFQQVPPGLADLLILRLEQVEQIHNTQGRLLEILERCAVLGNRFVFDVLQHMVDLEGVPERGRFVEEGIDLLLQEKILALVKGHEDDLLRFDHGLSREVLLQRMEGRRRLKRLHKLAGRAKEHFHRGHLEGAAVELAHHARASGDKGRELEFLLLAGRTERVGHNLQDAASYFARSIELARDVRGQDAPILLSLSRRVAGLMEGFGFFGASERAYAAVLRTALFEHAEPMRAPSLEAAPEVEPLDAADRKLLLEALEFSPRRASLGDLARREVTRSLLGLGRLARHQGHQVSAERCFALAIDFARENKQSLGTWRVSGQIQLGWCAWDRGDYGEAHALCEEALAAAIEHTDAYNRADALHLLADIARMRGQTEKSAEWMTQAQELFHVLGERRREAICLRDLASLARGRQDTENAARLFAEARRRFEELGDRHAVATCFNGLGEVARFMGRFDVAQSCYQRAFETLRSVGARKDAAIALTNLGQVALGGNDLESAEAYLVEASVYHADRKHPYLTVGLYLSLALLRARGGRLEAARRYLSVALEQSDRHKISDPDYARLMEELAQIWNTRGHEVLSQELMTRAEAMWKHLG